jgi:XTP/dITP diphosphohydrolase
MEQHSHSGRGEQRADRAKAVSRAVDAQKDVTLRRVARQVASAARSTRSARMRSISMETMQRQLVVATGNAKKLKELHAILANLEQPPTLVTSLSLGLPSPEEDGDSFEANALLKARAAFLATGLPTLADDSGLEVDALGGAPGIHSARFSGPEATDATNNAKLLALLAEVPPERRTARFRCCIAVVFPAAWAHRVSGATLADTHAWVVATGAVEGLIVDDARGAAGFGYDPYFLHPPSGRTFAELTMAEKQALSHRGRALKAMAPLFENMFDSNENGDVS